MSGMLAQQMSDLLADQPPDAVCCVLVQSGIEIVVAHIRGILAGHLLARRGGGWLFDGEAEEKRNCLLLHTAGDIEMTVAEVRYHLQGSPAAKVASSSGADTALCGLPLHVTQGSLVRTPSGLTFDDEAGGTRCVLIY